MDPDPDKYPAKAAHGQEAGEFRRRYARRKWMAEAPVLDQGGDGISTIQLPLEKVQAEWDLVWNVKRLHTLRAA